MGGGHGPSGCRAKGLCKGTGNTACCSGHLTARNPSDSNNCPRTEVRGVQKSHHLNRSCQGEKNEGRTASPGGKGEGRKN